MSKQKSSRKSERSRLEAFKIVVEKHADGYVAYPLGLKGVVVVRAIATSKRWPT